MRPIPLLAAAATLLVLSSAIRADDAPPAPEQAPTKKAPAKQAPGEVPRLPDTWHGVWKGPCTVSGPTRKRLDFPMELHVAPIDGRAAWTWRIVYGEGAKRQVRAYELLAVPGGKGHFRVDEKNGIVIDSWLHRDTLYSRFEIGSVSIDARYTLVRGSLEVSLVTTRVAPIATTGGEKGVPPVKAFPFVAVQRGTLSRSE